MVRQRGKLLEARVVGADSETLHQGQIALVFGNPRGLENSVSLGVVGSAGRQIHPDEPMIYIQTDARLAV